MAPEKQIREYDVVVVGAGNAGLIAANPFMSQMLGFLFSWKMALLLIVII